MAKILHRFYDLFSGGAEVVVLNIVRALDDHDHVLVFNRSEPSWLTTSLAQLPRVRLIHLAGEAPGSVFAAESPDVLIFHYYPPMSQRDLCQIPQSLHSRTFVYNHWFTPVPYVETVSGYCFPSRHSLGADGGSIPDARKTFILNPVSDRFFQVSRRRDEEFRVGRHSRDAPIKFSADVFELFERIDISELHVLMLGHSDAMGKLLATCSDRLRHTYWLLRNNTMDVARFLSFLDVYVYRTRADFRETSPLAILEAMACGLPIVAEAKGGIADLVTEGATGFLCKTVDEYGRAVEALHSDADLRTRCGAAAREWAREHASVNRFGRQLATWLALG